jgi:hypothetical protein
LISTGWIKQYTSLLIVNFPAGVRFYMIFG